MIGSSRKVSCSATASHHAARCSTVAFRSVGTAARAALTARSTSSGVPSVRTATVSPVDGLTEVNVAADAPSTHLPPMNSFWVVVLMTV